MKKVLDSSVGILKQMYISMCYMDTCMDVPRNIFDDDGRL